MLNRLYLFYLKKTNQIKWAKELGVIVGENCRLIDVSFSSEPYLVKLGDHVSATKVHFETHDGGVWVFHDKHPDWDIINKIVIGDNVFIGTGTIIMPGVIVGNNVIIGARSVVTKNIPSNQVWAGTPAKRIKEIDEYFEKVSKQVILTKNMNAKDKKDFLIRRFFNDTKNE